MSWGNLLQSPSGFKKILVKLTTVIVLEMYNCKCPLSVDHCTVRTGV